MVKDQLLGYPVAESMSMDSGVTEAIVYVPKNRNYSIMVYPNASMPASFNWDNFTSGSSYDLSDGLSNYNATTSTLNKRFNILINFFWIFFT